MNEQISFLPMLDDAEHPDWLLNGKQGFPNRCGVYTENVLEFREGLIPQTYVGIKLCAVGDMVVFDYSYNVGTYGCGHPLCEWSHTCHRSNSAKFLADCIYNVFVNSVLPFDGNLRNYKKETKKLEKLCRKACERIAEEVT